MTRYCTNCGAEVAAGATFCTNCGTAVSGSPQNVQSSAAGPARGNDRGIKWALAVAALLAAALLGLGTLAFIGFLNTGLVGLLVGMVLGTLPVPIYLALALWIDRYEKEPIWMLAAAFIWGATGAVFFSFIFNTLGGLAVGSALGPTVGEIFGGSISAPVVEETAKGVALFALYWWKKDEFDGVIDGIVYAAMVGLGFAMTENFSYYGVTFAEGGIAGSLGVFVLRGVISPFAHPLFTSMTGIGLGLARQSNKTWVKFVAPVGGLLAAMVLHSLWNSSGIPLGLIGFLLVYLLVMAPVLIGVLVVVAFSLRREGRIIRHYLTPELQSGLLSRQEYEALGSVGGRLGASWRALTGGGFGAWRTRGRFHQAASELAFHRDRVQRGISSSDDAGREAAYVRVLHELRGHPSYG